jgi:hypothetical protein
MSRKKGSPKTGGRQKGTKNKTSNEMRELTARYGPDALSCIVKIMEEDDDSQRRLRAAEILLERGFGRAKEHLDVSVVDTDTELERQIVSVMESTQVEKKPEENDVSASSIPDNAGASPAVTTTES